MEVVTSSLQKRETNLRIISKSSVKKQQMCCLYLVCTRRKALRSAANAIPT
jgi:hypothetical protein